MFSKITGISFTLVLVFNTIILGQKINLYSNSFVTDDYLSASINFDISYLNKQLNIEYHIKITDDKIGILDTIIDNIIYGADKFYLGYNGITVMCPGAQFGEIGIVNGKTYTKRTPSQINSHNASNTCTSGIVNLQGLFSDELSFNEDISSWDVSNVTSMAGLFSNASSFNKDISNWDVSNVTDMSYMFYGASSFNRDINNWEVREVQSMRAMFYNAAMFNQNIGNWNVGNVTDMSFMLYGASSFNRDISNWNVREVQSMRAMFYNVAMFNQNIGNWNVGNVTDMSFMFYGASSFNRDISNWDVRNVGVMNSMFEMAESFNSNINYWDVSNVTDMSYMFSVASSFNRDISNWDVRKIQTMRAMFTNAVLFNADISNWNVGNVTDMSFMLYGALSFNHDISKWDVSEVRSMQAMFYNAVLFNPDIGNWNVGNVTDMSFMLYNASSFNQNISSWDVHKVLSMQAMFHNAALFNQDIGSWNVGVVTDMSYMFYGALSFNHDISKWDVSEVRSMQAMFYNAVLFNADIGNWNVGNVTDMSFMLYNASSFNQNISSWDVRKVLSMQAMFHNAALFNQDIGSWNVGVVTDMSGMFWGATSFNSNIGDWDISKVSTVRLMFYNARIFNADIGQWNVGNVTNLSGMFWGATSFNSNIGDWDVSKASTMEAMFFLATSFNQYVGNWNVGNVTNMLLMFGGARMFNQNLGGWNVSNVKDMRVMFSGLISLDDLEMMLVTGMSTDNYDETLIGWANQNVQTDIILGADGIIYCNAAHARQKLIEDFNWTIYDAGLQKGCGVIKDEKITIEIEKVIVNSKIYEASLNNYPNVVHIGDDIRIIGRINTESGNSLSDVEIKIHDDLGLMSSFSITDENGVFEYSTKVNEDFVRLPKSVLFYTEKKDQYVYLVLNIEVEVSYNIFSHSNMNDLMSYYNDKFETDIYHLSAFDVNDLPYFDMDMIETQILRIEQVEDVNVSNFHFLLNQYNQRQTDPLYENPEKEAILNRAKEIEKEEGRDLMKRRLKKIKSQIGETRVYIYIGGGLFCLTTPVTGVGAVGCVIVKKMATADAIKFTGSLLLELADASEEDKAKYELAFTVASLITADDLGALVKTIEVGSDIIFYREVFDKKIDVYQAGFEAYKEDPLGLISSPFHNVSYEVDDGIFVLTFTYLGVEYQIEKYLDEHSISETYSMPTGEFVSTEYIDSDIVITATVEQEGEIRSTLYDQTPYPSSLPEGVQETTDWFWSIESADLVFEDGFISISQDSLPDDEYIKYVWLKRDNSTENWENIGGELIDDRFSSTEPFNSFSQFTIGVVFDPTSIDRNLVSGIPQSIHVFQNYPNPFNPITNIQYALPENLYVRLDIYNVMGQQAATLVNQNQQAGNHTVSFDASKLTSGVYLYRLQAGNEVHTRKMILVK